MQYSPANAPNDPARLQVYLQQEFGKIANALAATTQLPISYKAPDKPRDGMLVLADGDHWSPDNSSNPGFYGYRNGSWRRLDP